jgi:cell division septum initiation protein DivIVA
MINKELKKLNRRELVDVIYQLKKNEEQLQERIAALEAELEERRIHLSKAGSIADAAAELTDVFAVAQSTADLYLREIASMKEDAQKECDKMIEEAKKKVEAIMADGKKQYDALSERYRIVYNKRQQLRDEIKKLEKQKSNK